MEQWKVPDHSHDVIGDFLSMRLGAYSGEFARKCMEQVGHSSGDVGSRVLRVESIRGDSTGHGMTVADFDGGGGSFSRR